MYFFYDAKLARQEKPEELWQFLLTFLIERAKGDGPHAGAEVRDRPARAPRAPRNPARLHSRRRRAVPCVRRGIGLVLRGLPRPACACSSRSGLELLFSRHGRCCRRGLRRWQESAALHAEWRCARSLSQS